MGRKTEEQNPLWVSSYCRKTPLKHCRYPSTFTPSLNIVLFIMSWFASGLETLNQLSEQVQKAIPVDKEFLAKLTLNTDEMKAEREQFGEEAKRKEEAKDVLAGMFPWETRDSERDILVEECREAILLLSKNEETFYGPYEMPESQVNLEEENKKSVDGEDADAEEEIEEEETKKAQRPSEESLEKLAKLEPLPPLLRDFDLDSHVGLIQKLLAEDVALKEQQSLLSGGGAREKVFWHNYFFHCAYTRYEAGLSIDEIWSFEGATAAEEAADKAAESAQTATEETLVFDDTQTEEATPEAAFVPDETSGGNIDTIVVPSNKMVDSTSFLESADGSPSASASSEFEMLDGLEADAGTGDPELDELEAEIARELED